MAEKHASGERGRAADDLLLRPETCTAKDFTVKEVEERNFWSGPLAKTWTLMLLSGTCLLYCTRMAMPVCAVSMAAEFHWSRTESGLALGGFFWGYCLTQIPGGYASDRVGGEWVLFLSTASWASITVVTPLLAHVGIQPLTIMTITRFLMGLLQGVYYPSLASLCSQRVAEGGRGFMMGTMSSGCYLGTLLVGGLGSLMLEWYDWESVFYCTGFLSGIWALIVWRHLLTGILTGRVSSRLTLSRHGSHKSVSGTHWMRLLKKPPVCAMVFAHACYCGTSYTLLSWLPTFFEDTFPHAVGLVYNVVPWLFAIPSALTGGYLSDFCINRGHGVASVRKMMQVMAMGVSSLFLLLLCGPTTFPCALAYVSASMALSTFTSSGVSLNVQDLAPSCAGALFGFMNMCGAFMGLLLVSFSGYLIEVTLWTAVFSLITVVNFTGLGFFLVFGDAHRVDIVPMSPGSVSSP
ncbi:solute carrier family 17 member 9-like [Lampris incognitus]|uniref:solute carrier family 17 member 9-like n=1 Tax=Lampris incognitus TaxID=2546036 RepID=UPI0024B51FC6|nr:solute carrier family 17 member 9-like [Lampris incognitus]